MTFSTIIHQIILFSQGLFYPIQFIKLKKLTDMFLLELKILITSLYPIFIIDMHTQSNFEIDSHHTFSETGLHPFICSLLSFNKYSIPTPIQYQSVKAGIQNNDYNLVCQSKSGTGKTLAFVSLILQYFISLDKLDAKTYCVVIVPTRELAVQIFQIIKALLDSVVMLQAGNTQNKSFKSLFQVLTVMLSIGGLPFEDDCRKYREFPAQIIVCTVGRLWQLFKNHVLILNQSMLIVLDQADKLYESSDDKFKKVMGLLGAEGKARVLGFSATVGKKMVEGMGNKARNIYYVRTLGNIEGSIDIVSTDKISQFFPHQNQQNTDNQQKGERKQQDRKQNLQLENIKKFFIAPPTPLNSSLLDYKLSTLSTLLRSLPYKHCLIFIQKKSQMDQISQYLTLQDLQHIMIHGSLTQAARFRMMNRINQSKIIIASDLLARGIDVLIDLVILFDAKNGDTIWHRIGRTGRYGRNGVVVSLDRVEGQGWGVYDEGEVRKVLDGVQLGQKKEWYGGHMTQIGKWQDFDTKKQQQNEYKYFKQPQKPRKQKTVEACQEMNKVVTSCKKGRAELTNHQKEWQRIECKQELVEWIKQNILNCQHCQQLIKNTTELTGYQFSILSYCQ